MMSSPVTMPNASFVHRISEGGYCEALGIFQYRDDAVEYAKRKLVDDAERRWTDSLYSVFDTGNGSLTVVLPDPPEQVKK